MKKSFNRKRGQRKALLRSLAENFLLHEKIRTTEAKAKALRPYLEPLITRAKKKNLANQRHFARYFNKTIQRKLFVLGERYQTRSGGYLRITKLGHRASDSALMAIIELV